MYQKDILPEWEEERRSSVYIVLSFVFFALTLFLFVWLFGDVPFGLSVRAATPTEVKTVVAATYVSGIGGVWVSMMSLVRREKPTSLKLIGASLNVMTFLFLLVVAAYVLFWQ